MDRVFLISPAQLRGKRAQQLLSPRSRSATATALRDGGASIGAVMEFCSGLYFRGKLAYARRFGRARGATPAALIITPDRGLALPEVKITAHDVVTMSAIEIDGDERFTAPLLKHCRDLDDRLGGEGEVVLLGSIASDKYTTALLEVFGARLHFPSAFVSKGQLSRGSILLNAVKEGRELAMTPVQGATTSRARARSS